MPLSDDEARLLLRDAIRSVEEDYRTRGIFRDRFGFSHAQALVVVDFAYGWTDDAYAGGSRRLGPVEANAPAARRGTGEESLPIVYTTSPWRPASGTSRSSPRPDYSPSFRTWDERACRIDERVAPHPGDLVLAKENAGAVLRHPSRPLPDRPRGRYPADYRVQHQSTASRATATDAKSYRFRPIVVRECVGDRSPVAHEWTLFDIQARFADVVPLAEALSYLSGLAEPDGGGSLRRSARVRVSRRRSTRRARGRAARRMRSQCAAMDSPSGRRSS